MNPNRAGDRSGPAARAGRGGETRTGGQRGRERAGGALTPGGAGAAAGQIIPTATSQSHSPEQNTTQNKAILFTPGPPASHGRAGR